MKTTFNKFLKKTVATVAVMTMLVMGFGAANAQGLYQLMAAANTFGSSEAFPEEEAFLNAAANYVSEVESESSLPVEAWMSDEAAWGLSGANAAYEADLEIEAWMSSEYFWTGDINIITPYSELEEDAPLEIEHWMQCEKCWGIDENK